MSSPLFKAPKGTRDLDGPEGKAFRTLEEIARSVFELYGFSEVRTPIFESLDLFARTLGATSDVVQKEMFSFVDRGERTFALRPEGTAGVVRYFIEHNLDIKGSVHRLFYSGPMFRAERPQAGRYRQFWQIGSEHFGQAEPTTDADTVLMVEKIITDFGLKNFSIHINSLGCQECRTPYREAILRYLQTKQPILTQESRDRMAVNPLRVLDSKEDGPKLIDAPDRKNFWCEPCRSHYAQVLSFLRSGSRRVKENPRLVRGLDYYTRTVFEFVSPDLGAQSALAAGGRYDYLMAELGGPSIPGIGFALGMDRVVSARLQGGKDFNEKNPKFAFVIPMMEEALPVAFSLSNQLREAKIVVPPIHAHKKLKNQLSLAVDEGANWAILIGENELKNKGVTVKDLESREQKLVPLSEVVDQLLKRGEGISRN